MAPVPGEYEGQFVALQRPVVVGEADPAVELGIACHPFFDAGHADEHQAGAGAVDWSRRYSSAVADSRSASSMMRSSIWPGRDDLCGPGRELLPGRRVRRCSSMQMSARLVSSLSSSRSSRRVPPTVGV